MRENIARDIENHLKNAQIWVDFVLSWTEFYLVQFLKPLSWLVTKAWIGGDTKHARLPTDTPSANQQDSASPKEESVLSDYLKTGATLLKASTHNHTAYEL